MACHTKPGPAAFCAAVESYMGDPVTQSDWHELRKRAGDAGYDMSRTRVTPEEAAGAAEALARAMEFDDEETEAFKQTVLATGNTRATLSTIQYLTENGVDATLSEMHPEGGLNSHYDWEEGTILLPAAAVAPLKKVLREHANKMHADVLATAKNLVKEAGTTSPAKMQKWLEARREARWRNESAASRGRYVTPTADREYTSMVNNIAEEFIESRLRGGWDYATQKQLPPASRVTVPTVAELEKFGVKKMTNKDNEFLAYTPNGYAEATIRFNDRSVSWSVGENNHAVESAHSSPMAQVFFRELGKVKWTRGTGGVLVGNDEYNRDNYESGGGANYTTSRFGPVGEDDKVRDLMRMGMTRKKAMDYLKAEKAEAARRSTYRRW